MGSSEWVIGRGGTGVEERLPAAEAKGSASERVYMLPLGAVYRSTSEGVRGSGSSTVEPKLLVAVAALGRREKWVGAGCVGRGGAGTRRGGMEEAAVVGFLDAEEEEDEEEEGLRPRAAAKLNLVVLGRLGRVWRGGSACL